MAEGELPEIVARFLWQHIESVEQLEILNVLASDPSRAWSVAEVFAKVQSNAGSIHQRLHRFASEGIVLQEGENYRFNDKDPRMAETLRAVLSDFQNKSVRVIEAIYNRRTDAVQSFADAFKLKPRK